MNSAILSIIKKTDQNEVADWVVIKCLERLKSAVEQKGEALLVVAGGSTYQLVYKKLSESNFDWSKVTIIFTDERCVPIEDQRSNYLQFKLAWSGHTLPKLLRMPVELPNGSEIYDAQLKEVGGGAYPTFDLVLLGIGFDGHTASLFPDSTLSSPEVCLTEAGQDPFVPRMTLTYQALNRSKQTIAVATGESKAEIVKNVLHDENEQYPISRIRVDYLVLDSVAA